MNNIQVQVSKNLEETMELSFTFPRSWELVTDNCKCGVTSLYIINGRDQCVLGLYIKTIWPRWSDDCQLSCGEACVFSFCIEESTRHDKCRYISLTGVFRECLIIKATYSERFSTYWNWRNLKAKNSSMAPAWSRLHYLMSSHFLMFFGKQT